MCSDPYFIGFIQAEVRQRLLPVCCQIVNGNNDDVAAVRVHIQGLNDQLSDNWEAVVPSV